MVLLGTASPEEDGRAVEVLISGRLPGPADMVVVSSFTGRPRPRSILARTKDDDVVLLMSRVRELGVVVVELNEEWPLPPFVFALVGVGVVVLTTLVESFGLMPSRTPFVFASGYDGVVEVAIKVFLVVVVE